MSGVLTYWVREDKNRLKLVRLTVCSDEDGGVLGGELRRRRLARILGEAGRQNVRLGYEDLSMIMLASKSTIKRDMNKLRRQMAGAALNAGGEK